MFGESESESPRVPSPWDSLISNPPSPSPSSRSQATPSPLSAELIPRLVPEADDGNVEYKLQLLSPSPARFARLVTQLKWRLLEGGGQAYYELGVADSGALVGLPRAELEQSLETLEMMAGEIGASVIVVKEIEVPAAMAGLAASQTDIRNGKRYRKEAGLPHSEGDSSVSVATSTTETETDDYDDQCDDMSMTLVLDKTASNPHHFDHGRDAASSSSSVSIFSMDPEPDPGDNADAEPEDDSVPSQPSFSIDLEIASVFKPRPVRTRIHTHSHALMGPAKNKRMKKIKHSPPLSTAHVNGTAGQLEHQQDHTGGGNNHLKNSNRRQARDRKRAEKRKALLAYATGAHLIPDSSLETELLDPDKPHVRDHILPKPLLAETDALVSGLESLHVSLDGPSHSHLSTSPHHATIPTLHLVTQPDDDDGEDDVFASPTPATPFTTFNSSFSYLSASSAVSDIEGSTQKVLHGQSRLIVEALVVRKMSLDEAFLDFGGFALT